MIIERPSYIEKLLSKQWNGKVKIITGLRRCGKSFLLSTLYKKVLLSEGVSENQFIEIALDRKSGIKYRNPNLLFDYIVNKSKNMNTKYYVFIDEIQLSFKIKNCEIDEMYVPEEDKESLYVTFYDVLNDLIARPNLDVYVTGSNSKMLSKDIVTNFRDRGSEIRVHPLSFAEYMSVTSLDKIDAFEEYITYGGMPLAVIEKDEREKQKYLANLFTTVYFKDLLERYKIKDEEVLGALTDALCSAVGSLTNPNKLANTASSLISKDTTRPTIQKFIGYLEDAYLFESARRWNVKGRKYFNTIQKYYATDLGLRNARLNFRQQERSHLMENIIYNELIRRGYSVDVGIVEITQSIEGSRHLYQYEIDFVVNMGNNKIYIQSALNIDTPEKKAQEIMSLRNTGDFYRRIVIVEGNRKLWIDDGITYIGVIPFLLDSNLLQHI